MPEHKIVGRVRGKDIAPDTFEDALEQILNDLGSRVASLPESAPGRFGELGVLVRLSDALEAYLNSADEPVGTEETANALVIHSLILLALEKGIWDLPRRGARFSLEDEPEENLREH